MCAARGVGGTYFFAAGLAKFYEVLLHLASRYR